MIHHLKSKLLLSSYLILAFLIISSCATEPPPVYTLISNSEPTVGGVVTPPKVETYKGGDVLLRAKPNDNYKFVKWGGDYSGTENPLTIAMEQNKIITAIFEKVQYPITINIVGEGTVTENVIQSKTSEFTHGSIVKFTAIPEYGWKFVKWEGDINGSETEVEIEIKKELEFTAIFERVDFLVTVHIEGKGEVTQKIVQAKTTNDEYPFETLLELTAVPSADWKFYEWSGDLEGSESVEVVAVSGPITVMATFITTPSVVTSQTVTDLTENTARISAEVVASGGVEVTERGICWSTSQNPTTDDNCTAIGSGLGTFATTLNGLTEDTEYFTRAYAVNEAGTAYGNQVSFKTVAPVSVATVITGEITSVTTTSAKVAGKVTEDGNLKVTERGICWSTSPEIPDNFSESEEGDIDCRPSGEGLGDYSYTISGLEYGTLYYVRAYAINEAGYGIGEQKDFTTLNPELPSVTTLAVSTIGSTSAQSGGEVTSDGGGIVSERGVCWSTSQNPTRNDTCTLDGTGIGAFSSSISGLSPKTIFHIRAFATNEAGTQYGNSRDFQTVDEQTIATVQTSAVTSITTDSAIGGGNITDDGGSSITQRGICWSTSQNPTTSNSCSNSGSGIGSFSDAMSSLNSGTIYYVRAYAINSQGTHYGNQRSFETDAPAPSGNTVTDIDGNTYQVVQIGAQRWMASNLRTTRYRDGTQIPNVTNPANWTSRSTGAWAYYDNNSGYNSTYGKLYNWHAAANSRGICPTGWRVPSDLDFQTLEAALGMPAGELGQVGHRGANQNIGGKLKTTGNSLWRVPISDTSHKYYNPDYQEATNSSGFSGVPSGNLNPVDTTHNGPGFYSLTRDKDLWTSTPSGSNAFIRALSFNQSSVYRDRRSKKYGFAIRCVQ